MKFLQHIWFFALFSAFAIASPEKPNFQDDIIPIFEQSCNSCHNPDRSRGGLDLTSINGIIAGGSSGEVSLPGDPDGSLLYLLPARLQEPHMPPRGEKIEKSQLLLIKNWIAQGMLPTASGKPMKKKKSSVNLALSGASIGKPTGPPPMPKHLNLEPFLVTERAFAPSAMAASPWAPLVALSGQKQVILYNTETLKISGILPYEEGFIESMKFSRNGKLVIASGGRGGKSGNVAGWDIETGKRVLTVGEEQDSILTADLSADQSLVVIGGTNKLIKVFDLATDEILYKIKKHSEWVTQVAFSPDGILLATADRNGGLFVWEARTGNPFYTLDGHKQEITSLSWRADGNVLLSASEEGAVRTWEMINGKQIRTWNAHSGGTLSAHFAQNGNIVTAGRDKTVKFWDGNGKALRTISGFTDIVMESRLSHDGSKIIAGDWTGKVGLWNSSDGKHLGDLIANPPTIEKRILLSENHLATIQSSLKEHQNALLPLQQKRDKLTKALELSKANLDADEKNLQDSTAKIMAAKQELLKTTNDFNKKTNIKKAKSETHQKILAKIAVNQDSFAKSNQESKKWNDLSNKYSKQLSLLKDSLSKAKQLSDQNKSDLSLADAAKKAKLAFDEIKKKSDDASRHSANHKAETDNLIAEKKSLKLQSENASEALNGAQEDLVTITKLLSQTKSNLSQFQNQQSSITSKRDQSKSIFEKNKTLLAQCQEAIKQPSMLVAKASREIEEVQKDIEQWKAELINVERHTQIKNLDLLQNEMEDLTTLLQDAKETKIQALNELNNTRESLRLLPNKIAKSKTVIDQSKNSVVTAEKNHVSVIQLLERKKSFIAEFNSIAESSKKFSETLKPESTLQDANVKLAESLELFKKDLIETQNELAAKQEEIILAKQAVQNAEKSHQEILKLKETIPKLLEEKNQLFKRASEEYLNVEKEHRSMLAKIESQLKLTNELFSKYTKLLAINN